MQNENEQFARLSAREVLVLLGSSIRGISDEDAEKRLIEFGPNRLSEKNEVGIVREFFSHFKNPLIIILFFAASISAYMGQTVNAVIIVAMIVASVFLDFFEEHSANNAAARLREKVSNTSTVIRSGTHKEIRAADVCPGDVVFLSSGDLVPADARVLEADDFFVNQSALTGESFPNEKTPGPDSEAKPLIEYSNIVFLGTSVVSGTARCVVFRTGKGTEFGKIARDILKREEKSDFEIGIERFGYLIMKVIFFLVLFVFLFNSLVHGDILESFIFAIAIAVGITPELLPVVMSVTMAKGSQRMAKFGVIVKKLSSIPNFGGMDVLCTDKTGTLTEDRIEVVEYVDISGRSDESVFLYSYLNSYHQTGVKNPLDKAVLDFRKAHISAYVKIEEIPFDFVRKMMSIAVMGPKGRTLITKGAPEEVLARCGSYQEKSRSAKFDAAAKKRAKEEYVRLSSDGYRVLAVAIRVGIPAKSQYTHRDESNLRFVGFIAFYDPPKKGAKDIVSRVVSRGVDIKIVTGDNDLVTRKICSDVGLPVKGVLLSSQVRDMSDAALRIAAEKVTIFARFSPEEKSRVISALRAGGHVVGYLGDGINDAPSLKAADVGISVENAVDVAKESADIILTKKSLEPIVDGISEGRRSFGNTIKYVMMGLSSNFGNMFSVAGAVFFIPFLPMLPIQILLNNFLYDLSQTTIPTDNVDEDWIEKPRKWDMTFIRRFMFAFGTVSSVFDIITFVILFYVFRSSEGVFQTSWFMESLATQTLVIHVIRTRKIPFIQSRASTLVTLSISAIVLFGWLLPYTSLGSFFQFAPPPIHILAVIVALVIVYLCIVEAFKRWFYRRFGFMG